MNYQHAYHAGNAADVLKHYVLVGILAALRAKPAPFCVIDSHAGSGMYALRSPGEFEQGVGVLWPERDRWPALADYWSVIERFNGKGPLRRYPGSPLIIREALREQDRAVLMELHPEEHRRLKENLAGTRNVAVHHLDAWHGLKAFVPPRENRGLVLIDPPYEKPDEFRRIRAALTGALKHWRNGTFMVWYPIKAYTPVARFHAALAALGHEMTAVELLTLPLDVQNRLNGSGVVLVNPPWKLVAMLEETLPPLARRLAGPGGRPQVNVKPLKAGAAG